MQTALGYAGMFHHARSGLYLTHYRAYDPHLGRWLSRDPVGFAGGMNLYGYVEGDPLSYIDPLGLWSWGDPLPQGVVDFSAGFGDTLSFGLTDWVRDQMGINQAVDKCTWAYSVGEWIGIGYDITLGGAIGWQMAGARGTGKEFSHWIPNHMGGPRSKWNGNYVSPGCHYKHDPFRYPPRSQRSGNKWPVPVQQFDRISNVYKGGVAAGGASVASAMGNGCECQ